LSLSGHLRVGRGGGVEGGAGLAELPGLLVGLGLQEGEVVDLVDLGRRSRDRGGQLLDGGGGGVDRSHAVGVDQHDVGLDPLVAGPALGGVQQRGAGVVEAALVKAGPAQGVGGVRRQLVVDLPAIDQGHRVAGGR
jgi:hypothetical protein